MHKYTIFAAKLNCCMRILVLTETDACCGPMAAAFLRDYSISNEVVSAGHNPIDSIDPLVVIVMKECLIDLSTYVPKNARLVDVSEFDVVYQCPERLCPKAIDAYRGLRDFIKNEAYLFFRKMNL